MFAELLESVRKNSPLVHSITNYVTANDCANVLLALGASPIMADDFNEVSEITAMSNALVINIGTLNERTIQSMVLAGKKANELNIPVIFDPVGAGASKFRTNTALFLLNEIKFNVIRGNVSEMKALCDGTRNTRGVDANNLVNAETLDQTIHYGKSLAIKFKSIIVITGVIDIVTDGTQTYAIYNGHPLMSKISGTGCMLSAIIGGFCGANPKCLLPTTAAAVCTMGICGELGYQQMTEQNGGTATYKIHLIDSISKINIDILKAGAKIESR
ncbi:MAG: thiM [Anaerocolumna sp.]|jgi:hydroxyethylthiazole kinase|nr:thiM [Anaerocolumna sp.]